MADKPYYIVCRAMTTVGLSDEVCKLIDQGYVVSGSMQISVLGTNGREVFYHQPMVRKEEEEKHG